MNLRSRLERTVHYLQSEMDNFQPEIGIILGTGLGGLLNEIDIEYEIEYANIPDFVEATVEFHPGKLVFGTLSGKKVVCMSGRFHYYEGHTMEQVTYPVRVLEMLGITRLLISNASGGMNPEYQEGDLMIIEDHISLFLPTNPLIGECIKGDRFPDMSEPYDLSMIELAAEIVKEQNMARVQKGVYVSVTGPCLETKAEYRLLRLVGADAVGMSTVPEAIVAIQIGLKVFAISVITDMGIPETLKKAELSKILAAAHKAEPKMTLIIKEMIKRITYS
jgi:purine-nucleoside phosphorylase